MKHFMIKFGLVLCVLGVSPRAFSDETQETRPPRPYIGARLSSEIPDLLRKHLGLEDEHGLLVENIYRNGPADKAGLDKDDILLSLDGVPLKSPHELFGRIREVGVSGSIIVELIHLGRHETTTILLEAMGPDFRSNRDGWKYAIEPDESMVIRPGRMFRMPPGEREWIEIPLEQLRSGDTRMPNFGAQYHFLHDDGQQEFTVVIEGNPHEADASISVKTPEKEYFTTAGQIEMLPQEYHQTVRNDIEKARQSYESGRNLKIPSRLDFSRWQEFFAEGSRPLRSEQRGPDGRRSQTRSDEQSGRGQSLDSRLEELARQIELLHERQKELEVFLKERLGR